VVGAAAAGRRGCGGGRRGGVGGLAIGSAVAVAGVAVAVGGTAALAAPGSTEPVGSAFMMLTAGIDAADGKIGPDVDEEARLGLGGPGDVAVGEPGAVAAATGLPARVPQAAA
jgi:hypothetical protein